MIERWIDKELENGEINRRAEGVRKSLRDKGVIKN
jgi:hypothetical protein